MWIVPAFAYASDLSFKCLAYRRLAEVCRDKLRKMLLDRIIQTYWVGVILEGHYSHAFRVAAPL
jgi:hypothetical protein